MTNLKRTAKSGSGSPKTGSSPIGSPGRHGVNAPPAGEAPLEVDDDAIGQDDLSDNDSSLGTDSSSTTDSLASSVLRYRVENGRTYHSFKADEANYVLPNDERENDRLDLQHHIFVKTQGDVLYKCPAGKDGKPLQRVLDVGTGTGLWAVDVADEHPEASVLGIDLSPIQPQFIPPNVEFLVDNLDEDWEFGTPFDFIYMRMMAGSVRDWPRWIGQAYKNLKPGGYLELCDPANPIRCDDGTLPEDSALLKWNKLWVEAAKNLGAPLDAPLRYKHQLEDAGFTNIVQQEYKLPINEWPKDEDMKTLGMWNLINMGGNLEGLSLMLFTRGLGWSVEEVLVLVALVRKDLANRQFHAYWPMYVVYGQKPE